MFLYFYLLSVYAVFKKHKIDSNFSQIEIIMLLSLFMTYLFSIYLLKTIPCTLFDIWKYGFSKPIVIIIYKVKIIV